MSYLLLQNCIQYITALSSTATVLTESGCEIVPQLILHDITSWRRQGISMRDIVDRLLPRTVPPGYDHHTWIEGMYIQCI